MDGTKRLHRRKSVLLVPLATTPCGWLGTRCWKGGKIMSIEASTAALDPFCQEIIPPPEMRIGPLG